MDTLVTNIGHLITPLARNTGKTGQSSTLQVLEDSSILVRDGRIASIGGVGNHRAAEAVDACGGVVMPGLVDPHCHLRPPTGSRDEGPRGSQQSLPQLLHRALRCGTTTLGLKCRDSTGVFDELSDLQHAARGTVPRIAASLFCIPHPDQSDDSAGRLSSIIGEAIPTVRTRRLAPFCDVAVGDKAYSLVEARTILRAARGAGLRLKLSADGGDIEEAVRLATQLETTSVDFCAAPLLPSIEKMRSVDVVPVLLPSRFFIPHLAAPDVRPMIDRGLALALGTDHGAASAQGIGSVWTILAIAIVQLHMTLDEAITACTYNAARALGLGGEIGSLEVGKRADLLILDVSNYHELAEGLGRNPVKIVMVDGRVVCRR